jgi:hypothetical protein
MVTTAAVSHERAQDGWGARRFAVAVGLVALAALVVRLAYIWVERRDVDHWGDAYFYHQGGNLLADGDGFINPFGWLQGREIESADHPPLYIFYLAGWSLLGVRSTTGHMVASALLGVASVVVAAYLGKRVVGPRVGVLAAALVAVYPNVWRYDGMLLSETLVIFLVLVTVLVAYWFVDGPSPARLVALGVAIGLGTLARSELLLLVPLLLVPVALWARDRPWRWRLGWAAAASAASVLVLCPWLALNRARFEEPVLLTTNLGGTLAVSYCPPVFEGPLLGYWDFFCGPQAMEAAGITEFADPRSDGVLRDAGLRYARDNVGRLPVVVAARLGRIVGVYDPVGQRDLDAGLEGTTPWVATAGQLSLYPVMAAAAVGAVALRRSGRAVLPLLAPIVSVLVTVALFYGATRFRATAEGPLCVLAAVAVDAGLRWWRHGRVARTEQGGTAPVTAPVQGPAPVEGPTPVQQ